ncbi:MAG: hypothetical protein U1F42_05285 [Candidatus Competibacteraceae bacterium]
MLQQLRQLLTPEVSDSAGGAGVARLAKIEGVLLLTALADGVTVG